MPSQQDIDSKPAAMIGCFTHGKLIIRYRRVNNHDDDFEFVGVAMDDGYPLSERDEAMIINGICAMLDVERERYSLWLRDHAKRITEKREGPRE